MYRALYHYRCKMLMKIGLTLVLFIAVGLYYLAENNDGSVDILGWKMDINSEGSQGEFPAERESEAAGNSAQDVDDDLVKDKKENVVEQNQDPGENSQENEESNGKGRKDAEEHEQKLEIKDENVVEHVESKEEPSEQKDAKSEIDTNNKEPKKADIDVDKQKIEAKDDPIPRENEVKSESEYKIQQEVEDAVRAAEENAALENSKRTSYQDSMHLAVVACGDRLEETLVMIKSALIFNRGFLHIHIFADDDLQPLFKKKLDSLPEAVHARFQYHIYDIQFPASTKPDEWRSLFKPCATQRLFIPDILLDVPRLIYVDTDILFLRPIDDVWAFFSSFNSSHLAALAWEHEDGTAGWYNRFARHPYYPPFGVNSGVMLMDLPRIRAANWTALMKDYYREYKLKITWGDQDLINIFFHDFPEKLYIFHCPYNYRPDHCMYMQTCKAVIKEGVSVLHGCRGVYHNEKQITFKAIYEAFKEYEFGDPLESHLLMTARANLDDTVGSKDRCATEHGFFTKQLAESIKQIKR